MSDTTTQKEFEETAKEALLNFSHTKTKGNCQDVLPVFLTAKAGTRGSFTECSSGAVLRELPTYKHKGQTCLVLCGLGDVKSLKITDYSLFFLASRSSGNRTKKKDLKKLISSKVNIETDQGLIIIPVNKKRSFRGKSCLKDYRKFSVKVMTDVERTKANLVCQIIEGRTRSFEVKTCKLEYHYDHDSSMYEYVLHLGKVVCKTRSDINAEKQNFYPDGCVILEKESALAVGVLTFVDDKIYPLFFGQQSSVFGRYNASKGISSLYFLCEGDLGALSI